ncbi:uncharacterized protein B0T23DRAFT_320013, partial [Neurospora hispaniola]
RTELKVSTCSGLQLPLVLYLHLAPVYGQAPPCSRASLLSPAAAAECRQVTGGDDNRCQREGFWPDYDRIEHIQIQSWQTERMGQTDGRDLATWLLKV